MGSCPAARRGARLRAGLTPASASNTLSCLLEMLHSKQLRSIKMLIDSNHGIYRDLMWVGAACARDTSRPGPILTRWRSVKFICSGSRYQIRASIFHRPFPK